MACLPADVPSAHTYPWHWLGVRLGRWGWLGAIHVGGLGLGLGLGLSGCSARGHLCVHRGHVAVVPRVARSVVVQQQAAAVRAAAAPQPHQHDAHDARDGAKHTANDGAHAGAFLGVGNSTDSTDNNGD